MTNSADPDQLASSEANWSGSTLFAKSGHVVLSKRVANIVNKFIWLFSCVKQKRQSEGIIHPWQAAIQWRTIQYYNEKWKYKW